MEKRGAFPYGRHGLKKPKESEIPTLPTREMSFKPDKDAWKAIVESKPLPKSGRTGGAQSNKDVQISSEFIKFYDDG